MGPYQVLPFGVRGDQIAMAMKGYSAFFKAYGLEPQHRTVLNLTQGTRWRKGSYSYVKVQLAYSTVPA